ncbi:MAG: hypothetical protein ABSH52_09640 [Terriglobia bacterium]|jgi:hypothetical protein
MKELTLSVAKTVILGWQGEIRRNPERRYSHGLPRLLLVATGISALQVA